MTAGEAVIFDDTALLALGSGSILASRIASAAVSDGPRTVFVPTLSLAAAEALRLGVAEHAGALPSLELVELDFSAATRVGGLVRSGIGWGTAHAIHVAWPSPQWPTGLPVLTTSPRLYDKAELHTIRIPDDGA